MASNRRTHIPSDSFERSPLARKHLTRQEFGRRLYSLILKKGWTQSELARQAGVLRDSISNYVRGNHLPEPANLKKIAEALGVGPEELLPNYTEQAIDMDVDPVLEIRAVASDPSMAWIRINRMVRSSGVPKILDAVEEAAYYDEDTASDA